MKKLLATAVLVLAAHMSYAQDQLFTKYEEVKGVETVFISKALLSVAAGSKIGDLDIRKVAKKLEQVRILSVEKASLVKTIQAEALAIYKRDKYEELMRMSEGDEKTVIYVRPRGKNKEFVLLHTEKHELDIISLIGNLTMEELKAIAD